MRNKIEIVGDVVNIDLGGGQSACIDLCDLALVHNSTTRSWTPVMGVKDVQPYVRAILESGKSIGIHKLIMNPPKGKVVDHIDRNPFNNRRSNLRIVEQWQNARNAEAVETNISGCPGVTWRKKEQKWRVVISVNGHKKQIGETKDLELAIKMRKDAEEKYWGFRTE